MMALFLCDYISNQISRKLDAMCKISFPSLYFVSLVAMFTYPFAAKDPQEWHYKGLVVFVVTQRGATAPYAGVGL